MPAVQTTYPTGQPKAAVGMWVNMENYNSITRLCETVAGIAFGLAVSRGSNDNGVVVGCADIADFIGVTLRDVTLIAPAGGTVDKYPRYANMGVATLGKIWVAPVVEVSPGDPVHIVVATGKFTNVAYDPEAEPAEDPTVGPLVGATFESSADADELAILNLGIQR